MTDAPNDLPVVYADPKDFPVPIGPDELWSDDPEKYGPAVLRTLQAIAFTDPGEFLSWGPRGVRVKSSEELTPLQRMLVQSVREGKDGEMTVTLCSKDNALRLLAQMSGLVKQDLKLSGKIDIGLLDVLREIDGRSRGLPSPAAGEGDGR